MMIRISQLKINIEDANSRDAELERLILKKLKLTKDELVNYRIFKESIDARRGTIHFVYTVDVEVAEPEKILTRKLPHVTETPNLAYEMPKSFEDHNDLERPLIIGFGPAGMFAALLLAQVGLKPIVLERGGDVDARVQSINAFFEKGMLDTESNIQFGEGGAGTFSDGKLTTRVKDLRGRKVLEELVNHGSPEEILYMAHPHVGTDLLRNVVKNIRDTIISLGGEIRFNTRATDFLIEDGQVHGIVTNQNEVLKASHVLLAIGHSARDTFEKLHESGVDMMAKPFAVGARIEHPQSLIDLSQYKDYAGHPSLGAAEYRLTHQARNGRGVYTFCMCPGGTVVASSSEAERLVTNGMSEHARDKENANSAILVQVKPEDFGDDHPLAGIEFQRRLEEKAFELGGKDYKAPAQRVEDFLNERPSEAIGAVKPSYPIGVKLADLNDLFPEFVLEAMKDGILAFDKKLAGFAMDDALLTAVESRSSSPVRINRDRDTLQSTNTAGLYPSGEGAGFAGGIMSSAIDGLKCAEKIIESLRDD